MLSIKTIKFRLLLSLGILFLLTSIVLYWFLYSDSDRYVWLIHQPYPLSHIGGMHFSSFILGTPIIIGIAFIIFSIFVKFRKDKI